MIDVKIVCENEKYMPEYATEFDACMDLKACGDYTVNPKSTKIIDTGIKFSVPKGYVMQMFVRSSVGIKHGCNLANSVGIIDSGFRQTLKVALYNRTNEPVEIKDGQRVAQFMVIPRPKINLVQVQDDEKFREGDRGGGIGSTGSN